MRYDVSVHIEIVLWILHLYNPTEITKSHLVSTLELPVVISMNLNCIICKVDKLISHVIMVELLTRGAHIPVFVEISLKWSINGGQNSVTSQIKFSLVDQKRVIDVFLNDEGPVALCSPANYGFYLLHRFAHVYAGTTISVFPRFNDPRVFWNPIAYLKLLNLSIVWVILGKFFVLFIIFCCSFSLYLLNRDPFLFFHTLDLLFQLLVVLGKLCELGIFYSFPSVESKREYFEWVLPNWVVVLLHINKYTLLVGKLFVLLKLVVKL